MAHVLVIAPLASFIILFIVLLGVRAFLLYGSKLKLTARGRQSMGTVSNASIEIGCGRLSPGISRSSTSQSSSIADPPTYYPNIIATESSAFYPVYVPPYSAPLMSLRDPRQFQGLPGLSAPPPYPPPPSYSQINNFPELPMVPHAVVDSAQQPRLNKNVDNVTPVE